MAQPAAYPFRKAIKKLLPGTAFRHLDRAIKIRRSDAIIVSYPKCGRTWLRAMLTVYCTKLYGISSDLLIDFINLHQVDRRIPRLFFSHEVNYKAAPASVSIDRRRLTRTKLIFLTRDPRDVIVSLYAHRVYRDHDWRGSIETFLTSADGGLLTILQYYKIWNEYLTTHSDALVIRYEDLHADPCTVFQALLGHLGQPVIQTALVDTVNETTFPRLREMERQSQFRSNRLNAQSIDHPEAFKVRRGVVGGFVDDLRPELVGRMNQTMDRELQGAFGYQAGGSA